MNGVPITQKEIQRIIWLRERGHSLPEICIAVKRGNSTVFKYAKNVIVLPEYIGSLKLKQGGSRIRSEEAWKSSVTKAKELLDFPLTKRERLCLLAGVYWGEGSKTELNLINSDPTLVSTFISGLKDLSVPKHDIKINLRLYHGINKITALSFWSKLLDVPIEKIGNIEMIDGKKPGKLQYGMCRVRVAKSATYFKLLMSLINELRTQIKPS